MSEERWTIYVCECGNVGTICPHRVVGPNPPNPGHKVRPVKVIREQRLDEERDEAMRMAELLDEVRGVLGSQESAPLSALDRGWLCRKIDREAQR